MSDPSDPFESDVPSQAEERLLKLETVVMHLAHDVEQMHELLLAQQTEFRGLRAQLTRLESQLQKSANEPHLPDHHDERPPHY